MPYRAHVFGTRSLASRTTHDFGKYASRRDGSIRRVAQSTDRRLCSIATRDERIASHCSFARPTVTRVFASR